MYDELTLFPENLFGPPPGVNSFTGPSIVELLSCLAVYLWLIGDRKRWFLTMATYTYGEPEDAGSGTGD
ncbi:MAG: hypothetical protein ABJA10_04955, partial [Aestuariivirga sp.]